MRILSGLLAVVNLLALTASLAAEPPPKPGDAPKAGDMPKQGDPPSMSTKPPSEIEGKSLGQWLIDLKHLDPSNREYAIRIIPLFGKATSEVVDQLIARCSDHDPSPRVRAIMSFQVLDVDKQHYQRIVEMLAKHVKEDPQLAVRYQAAVSLLRFSETSKPVCLNAFVAGSEFRENSAFEMRHACVLGIVSSGSNSGGPDPLATRTLINVLDRDPAARVRQEAAIGLFTMGKPTDPLLLNLVKQELEKVAVRDKDRIVVVWATAGLMQLGFPPDHGVQTLAKSLAHTDPKVRFQATRAIAVVGAKGKNPRLTKETVPLLIPLLKATDPAEASMAAWALGELGDPGEAAIRELTDLAADNSTNRDERNFVAKKALETIKFFKK